MLRDRVDTAVDLYKRGAVQKLLMSGDNSRVDYNEPDAMATYAIAQGVPAADIQPDYGGRRTYDSCYRARDIFHVKSAIIVTQAFHLPRALFLCDQLGVQAVGVAADRNRYDPRSIAWSETREVPALLGALYDAIRKAPPPILGSADPHRIDQTGVARCDVSCHLRPPGIFSIGRGRSCTCPYVGDRQGCAGTGGRKGRTLRVIAGVRGCGRPQGPRPTGDREGARVRAAARAAPYGWSRRVARVRAAARAAPYGWSRGCAGAGDRKGRALRVNIEDEHRHCRTLRCRRNMMIFRPRPF